MTQDVNNFCRLCLSDDLENLHHNIFDEGLSNRIIILTGLDVQYNDALPKNICRECRYQLERSYFFRCVAKQTDSRFRKHIRLLNQNKPSSVLEKSYQDDDTEEFEELFLESSKYFQSAEESINQLKINFESEKEKIIQEELKKELANISPPRQTRSRKIPENPVVLNICAPSNQQSEKKTKLVLRKNQVKTESSPNKDNNEMFLQNYEIEIMSPTQEVQEEDIQPVYYEINENNFDAHETIMYTEENLIEEVDEEEDEEDTVTGCSDEEYNPPEEKIQVDVVTHKSRRKKKEIKKETASTKKQPILIEPGLMTEDKYFIAIDDSEVDDLDENGEKKIFLCAFKGCDESFARRQACKTHFYDHFASQKNGYKCKFCQKSFKVASALERHERVHTGDRPFKCDHLGCNKAFSQKEMLKRHKVIHLSIEEAPFACSICEKRFRQKEPLRQHISKAHSEDSEIKSHPFDCSICDKKFAHSSGLSRHLLIHSGRRFTCEVCDKVFNDQSALKRHRSIHSKSK